MNVRACMYVCVVCMCVCVCVCVCVVCVCVCVCCFLGEVFVRGKDWIGVEEKMIKLCIITDSDDGRSCLAAEFTATCMQIPQPLPLFPYLPLGKPNLLAAGSPKKEN